MGERDILVSFDIVALFTNIHVDDALKVIEPLLVPGLYRVASACLKSTYFCMEWQILQIITGTSYRIAIVTNRS